MDLNQITLNITNFEESVEFYQNLGLKLIVSARGEYARFELPSGNTTLSLHTAKTIATDGPVHYFEVADVDEKYLELRSNGIQFESAPKDESWLWREARFSDPSGNKFCLYHAGENRRNPPWRID